MAERRSWERMEGEPSRPYSAFCIYRELGPERSLTKAARHYLTVPADTRATTRRRQHRRFRTHERPNRYLRAIRSQWRRWACRWRWVERCRAYDEFREAERQRHADRMAAEAAIAEAEENERQRRLRREEARLARTVGRQLLTHALQAIEAGELDRMSLPELLPHLQTVCTLIEVGQRLERDLELERTLARLERVLHLGEWS